MKMSSLSNLKSLVFGGLLLSVVACNSNTETEEIKDVTKDEVKVDAYPELQNQSLKFFGALPKVAENPENPVTDEKVALGKKLYFDNILSKDNKQSCNTCHNVDTYGVDNNSFSVGNDGGLGGRNSPSTFNAALHIAQFWDGREPDVEAQAGGPVLNPVEMAMPNEKAVVDRLKKVDEYQTLFASAFPDDKNPITFDNLKKAIGAYERKLITPSKFDDYLAGDVSALSDDEKEGLNTFINVGCTSCHNGAILGGTMFQKFGTFGDYWELTKSEKIDNGKFDVSRNEADKYVFKVPSLRNVEKTYPYFHDGSVANLGEAVKIMAKLQLNKDLTDKEVNSIVTFLKTLTADIPVELKQ
jgi:cytochrome c peroxidase